ncbi:MAG: phosphoribosylglycinamide formyltransferase, partial [Bacteroidales bacterium]|nr:phosphoribosylglycinamide formyltransferase [Bacteroidales bacterium]
MIKTAIFASGSGTNAMNIIHFFRDSAVVSIEAVLSNKPDAPVLQKAAAEGVETLIFSRDEFYNNSIVYNYLSKKGIELIILAGFLWLVPENMVNTWQGRIVNIHPALLPSYGGRGMYGDKVHKAVIENGEKQSGISIHLVN